MASVIKVGGWQQAQRILRAGPARFRRAVDRAVLQEAQLYKKEIVQGLTSGRPGGKTLEPLSPTTLATRRARGMRGSKPLIARGDLEIGGGFSWRGLILVGGALRALGDARLDGAAIVWLDSAAVSSPLIDLGSGRVDFRFDSCAVEAAALKIAPSPVEEPGTWHEVL